MRNQEVDVHNRRRFSRIHSGVEAHVSDGFQSQMACPTRDVSLQGIFLETSIPFALGSMCLVTLVLGGTVDPLEIKIQARVQRCQKDGVAFQFVTFEDLESWQHLRNIVLYNSDSPETILHEEDELLFKGE